MHHQNRIFRNGQRLRISGFEIDDQRRLAGIGRRVDPCVDAALRHRGHSLVAAPVESGDEATVHLGSGDNRRREGEHRHAEAERVRVPCGHARRGGRDANGLDFALKPRPMGRPEGLRDRIAMVVGERIGERRGGTVARLRVAIEPGQNVTRRRTAQSHERRKRCSKAERE